MAGATDQNTKAGNQQRSCADAVLVNDNSAGLSVRETCSITASPSRSVTFKPFAAHFKYMSYSCSLNRWPLETFLVFRHAQCWTHILYLFGVSLLSCTDKHNNWWGICCAGRLLPGWTGITPDTPLKSSWLSASVGAASSTGRRATPTTLWRWPPAWRCCTKVGVHTTPASTWSRGGGSGCLWPARVSRPNIEADHEFGRCSFSGFPLCFWTFLSGDFKLPAAVRFQDHSHVFQHDIWTLKMYLNLLKKGGKGFHGQFLLTYASTLAKRNIIPDQMHNHAKTAVPLVSRC